jgi:hypothetical protein
MKLARRIVLPLGKTNKQTNKTKQKCVSVEVRSSVCGEWTKWPVKDDILPIILAKCFSEFERH